MANCKMAPRQAAKKPSRRTPIKKATAKRVMTLRTRDPVRTGQMKSHEDGAKPTKKKRAAMEGREGSTSKNSVTPSSGLFTMLMQWSPLGIFLRQQAFFADALSQAAQTSRR